MRGPHGGHPWLHFARTLYAEVQRDQVGNGAAALAFYTMLAVFPAAIFGLSLFKARGVALLLMLVIFALLVTTFGLVILGGVLQDWLAVQLGWSPLLRACFALFRWLVIAIALLAGFALVYRIAPNTRRPFRMFRAGNLVAVGGFLLASFGFRIYVANFGSYDATYGGLGAVIVLMLWLFLIGWVILLGGEINDLLEKEKDRKAPSREDRLHPPSLHSGASERIS